MDKHKIKPLNPDLPRSENFLKETDINQLADNFFQSEFLTQFGREQGRKIARAKAISMVASQYLDMVMFETTETEYEFYYDHEISTTIH